MTRWFSGLSGAVLVLVAVSASGVDGQQAGSSNQVGRTYYSNPFAQSIHWLGTPQIEQELELVPEQKEKIAKIREGMTAEMRELYKQLRDVKQADRYEKYNTMQKELAEKAEEAIRQVLLVHQRDRLRQIVLQMQLRSYAAGAQVLICDEIAEQLGITDEQKGRLQAAQVKSQKEFQQKTQEFFKQIQQEMLEKVFSELTPGQRKKLDEMMGTAYEAQPVQVRPGS